MGHDLIGDVLLKAADTLRIPAESLIVITEGPPLRLGVSVFALAPILGNDGRVLPSVKRRLRDVFVDADLEPCWIAGLDPQIDDWLSRVRATGASASVTVDKVGRPGLHIRWNAESKGAVEELVAEEKSALAAVFGARIAQTSEEIFPLGRLLSLIKLHQPVTLARLATLTKTASPEDRVLARALDAARTSKFVIWQASPYDKGGEFVLTLRGLELMPSGRSKRSSDVLRALALTRRSR